MLDICLISKHYNIAKKYVRNLFTTSNTALKTDALCGRFFYF